MRAFAASLALCLAVPAVAHSDTPPAAAPKAVQPTIAFKGGRWFDGAAFRPARWYAVDGRLTARRPKRIDVTVDLGTRYVLPPLVEAHNHNAQNAFMAPGTNRSHLAQGIFYSVQMCAKREAHQPFSGFFNRPTSLDVVYSEACFSSSDGHPLGIALASMKQAGMNPSVEEMRKGYDPINSLADLDREWPRIAANKPDFVKLILINSERRAADAKDPAMFGWLGLDPALVQPIVDRAHAAGIRVIAHGDSAADIAIAVRAGADMIAHLPGYRIAANMKIEDYRIADDTIAEAAQRGTVFITTASVAKHDIAKRPHHEAPIRAMQIENLTRLRAANVPIAIGSDDVMGNVIGEILYLDTLGVMPRAELLRRATQDSARLMFPNRRIGAFAEGAEASLVAYGSDPLAGLAVLRTPAIRIKQGALLAD